jgi:hypothetical protein
MLFDWRSTDAMKALQPRSSAMRSMIEHRHPRDYASRRRPPSAMLNVSSRLAIDVHAIDRSGSTQSEAVARAGELTVCSAPVAAGGPRQASRLASHGRPTRRGCRKSLTRSSDDRSCSGAPGGRAGDADSRTSFCDPVASFPVRAATTAMLLGVGRRQGACSRRRPQCGHSVGTRMRELG